jgi:riboflavin kinase / FMN adenylyltransferase
LKIFNSIDSFEAAGRTIVSTGTFDGVHQGHRAIIRRMQALQAEGGGETVIVTFDPHPRIALGADADKLRLLTTTEEKAVLLEAAGIDKLIIQPFTREFAATPYRVFAEKFLMQKIRASHVVVGYNHHFGSRREGNYGLLQELAPAMGMELVEVSEVDVAGGHVSSTVIRELLQQGEVSAARRLLGYCFVLQGGVIHGDKRGRRVGFPTANVGGLPSYKMIPATGVYAVRAEVSGRSYHGMCNIGYKPTFTSGGAVPAVEVHLFGFDGDIYGEKIRLHFAGRLRGEKKFSGAEALAEQLKKDRELSENILKTCNCGETTL